MDRRLSVNHALQEKIESFYKKKGLPVTAEVQKCVENSLQLGLSDEEVLEHLELRDKKAPSHLVAGALVLLCRSNGEWVKGVLTEVREAEGYVVEWKDTEGKTQEKVVGFENSPLIQPRTWDPELAGKAAVKVVEESTPPTPPQEELVVPEPEPEKKPEPEPEPEPEKAPEPEPEPEPEPKKVLIAEEPVVVEEETPAPEPAKPALASPILKKKAKKSNDELLSVAGRGTGMLDEMVDYLEDDSVMFALVNVPLGSGTFQRNKLLFLPWIGEKCPAMRRARNVQRTGEVSDIIGSTHASLTLTSKSEVTIEHVLSELKHVFVTDNGEFSIEALKKEINDRVEEAKVKQEEAIKQASMTMAELPNVRPTAISMGLTVTDVMKELRKPLGAMNWALFAANPGELELVDAGSDSIAEMASLLEDSEEKVLFGLLRLGFGIGDFRRTKWICITFVGANISAVRRGKLLSSKGQLESMLKPHQVSLEFQGADSFTVDDVITKVAPFIVSDSITKDKKVSDKDASSSSFALTMTDFAKALAEERVASAGFFGEDPSLSLANLSAVAPFDLEEYDVKETIEKVKSNDDPLLWAVFELNC